MQLKVPEKFGICGFNDIEMAAYAEPALSTVRVNRYNMGSKAMEVIFEKITSPADKASPIARYINTGFELVTRKSTR